MTSSTVRSPIISRIAASERSRKVCAGSLHVEEILPGVVDPVLHHPFDESRVEIARDHRLFSCGIARGLVGIGISSGEESKLELQLAACGQNGDLVDPERKFKM